MVQFAAVADFKTVTDNKPNKELKNRPARGDERGFLRERTPKKKPQPAIVICEAVSCCWMSSAQRPYGLARLALALHEGRLGEDALATPEAWRREVERLNSTVRTESPQIQNFIDGKFAEPIGGKYLDNIEPATGKPYSQVADSDARDVEAAVAAAEKAFVNWSKKSAAERSKLLLR